MINIVRRATVEDFNLAIVRPPVQTKGIIFFMDAVRIVYYNYICTENMLMYIKCFETIFDFRYMVDCILDLFGVLSLL